MAHRKLRSAAACGARQLSKKWREASWNGCQAAWREELVTVLYWRKSVENRRNRNIIQEYEEEKAAEGLQKAVRNVENLKAEANEPIICSRSLEEKAWNREMKIVKAKSSVAEAKKRRNVYSENRKRNTSRENEEKYLCHEENEALWRRIQSASINIYEKAAKNERIRPIKYCWAWPENPDRAGGNRRKAAGGYRKRWRRRLLGGGENGGYGGWALSLRTSPGIWRRNNPAKTLKRRKRRKRENERILL